MFSRRAVVFLVLVLGGAVIGAWMNRDSRDRGDLVMGILIGAGCGFMIAVAGANWNAGSIPRDDDSGYIENYRR